MCVSVFLLIFVCVLAKDPGDSDSFGWDSGDGDGLILTLDDLINVPALIQEVEEREQEKEI